MFGSSVFEYLGTSNDVVVSTIDDVCVVPAAFEIIAKQTFGTNPNFNNGHSKALVDFQSAFQLELSHTSKLF